MSADPAASLREQYAHPQPAAGRSWVRGCMIASADGSACGPDGLSGSLGTELDHQVFALMREFADVSLVGVGTVRAEQYGPDILDHGQLAVVSNTGDFSGTLLDGPPREGIWAITSQRGAQDHPSSHRMLVCGEDRVDLGQALAALREAGLSKVLAEGGPTLLGSLLEQDLLDEVCLTISPTLVGGEGPRILHASPGHRELDLAHCVATKDGLATRWLVHTEPNRHQN